MTQIVHSVSQIRGSTHSRKDRVYTGPILNVANVAGAGAGAAVTTTVTLTNALPLSYVVVVDPKQDATTYVTNRTANSFDVVLTPRLAASTLASGTFDCLIVG